MFIGLTGGIGAGKSTALHYFSEFGFSVHDSDTIVHDLYRDSEELFRSVKLRWDIDIRHLGAVEGRKQIAEVVFKDSDELSWLEQLIHPLVYQQMEKVGKEAAAVCAVPLLFEKQWQNLFDYSVSISCTNSQQMRRLRNRGWSDEQIEARLSYQLTMEEKACQADYVIANTGNPDYLRTQCQLLSTKLLSSNSY